MSDKILMCDHCRVNPATCFGSYEGGPHLYTCDDCCGHGNEDGHCQQLPDMDGCCAEIADLRARLADAEAKRDGYEWSTYNILVSLTDSYGQPAPPTPGQLIYPGWCMPLREEINNLRARPAAAEEVTPAPAGVQVSDKQLHILRHALGLDQRKEPYRNSYSSAPGCDSWDDLMYLVAAGLMEKNHKWADSYHYFYVTEAGRRIAMAESGNQAKEVQ